MFIFSFALFSEFLLLVLFSSLGLVLQVQLSNFIITMILFCMQQYQSELLAFLFTTPFNFQKRKVNIYNFFATFCLIVVFCTSAPTPVTLAAIYFLKRERVAIFIYIILFYYYFPFQFLYIYSETRSSVSVANELIYSLTVK